LAGLLRRVARLRIARLLQGVTTRLTRLGERRAHGLELATEGVNGLR
jgi:hypothetical protein